MTNLLFMDVETGGLDTSFSLLTAYLAVYNRKLEKLGELELKIKPDKGDFVVTAKAMEVNRIDLEKHRLVAISETEAGLQLSNFLDKYTVKGEEKLVAVGHNVNFDVGFITAKLLSEKKWHTFCEKIVLDTAGIGMFLKLLPGILPENLPNSLGSYAEYYNLPRKNLHDAKNDVMLNVAVFKKMMIGRLSLTDKRE